MFFLGRAKWAGTATPTPSPGNPSGFFPAYLILCNDIWRTYLVARHSDWVWACSPLHLRKWVEGVEFVPPAPPLSAAAVAASWTA